jgi:hypothetical protein
MVESLIKTFYARQPKKLFLIISPQNHTFILPQGKEKVLFSPVFE